MTVNVLCFKSKVLKNGENPLMLCICKDRKRKYLSLGVSINLIYWDFEKQKPKRNCPNRVMLEKLILEKTRAYTDQILEFKAMDKEFTASSLMQKVNNPVKVRTVKEVFDLYIEQLKASNCKKRSIPTH